MMPWFSPLYPPWPLHVNDVRWWAIFCEIEEEKIAAVLPKCFKPIGKSTNIFEVYVAKFPKTPYPPYNEVGIIVPVKFKDLIGSYWLIAYLDEVEPICAGREVIGIPKKDAKINIEEKDSTMECTVERRGFLIAKIRCDITGAENLKIQIPPEWFSNRFTVRIMPKVDNPAKCEWVVARLKWDQKCEESLSKTGKAQVTFKESPWDPLTQLQPKSVLGAIYYYMPKSAIFAGEVLERLEDP